MHAAAGPITSVHWCCSFEQTQSHTHKLLPVTHRPAERFTAPCNIGFVICHVVYVGVRVFHVAATLCVMCADKEAELTPQIIVQ